MKIVLILLCLFQFSFRSSTSKFKCVSPLVETNYPRSRGISPLLGEAAINNASEMFKKVEEEEGEVTLTSRNLEEEEENRYKQEAFNDFNYTLTPKVRSLKSTENLLKGKGPIRQERDSNSVDEGRRSNRGNDYSDSEQKTERVRRSDTSGGGLITDLPGRANLSAPIPPQRRNLTLPPITEGPKILGNRSLSGKQALPQIPSIPGLPSLPRNQTLPGMPSLPGFPSLSRNQTLPGIPSLPGTPSIPGGKPPSLPKKPSLPDVPTISISRNITIWTSEVSYYLGGETFPEEGRLFNLSNCNDTFQYHILPSKFFVPPVVVVIALEVAAYKVSIYWRELRLYECAKIEDEVCDFVSIERVSDGGTEPFILRTTDLLDYSYISIISENDQILVGVGHEQISPSLVIATGAETPQVKSVKLTLRKIRSKEQDEEPDYWATFPDGATSSPTDEREKRPDVKPSAFYDLTYIRNPPYRHPLVEDLMVVERCQYEEERELLIPFNSSLSLFI